MAMADLLATTLARVERSEPARVAALWAFTVILAVAFLALLVGDQVRAASFSLSARYPPARAPLHRDTAAACPRGPCFRGPSARPSGSAARERGQPSPDARLS